MKKKLNLFSTPKKAIATSACLVAVVALLGTGTALALPSIAEKNSIGKASAESKALADAGINAADAKISRTEFDRENGKYVYEVEFTANGMEYDYILNAKTGDVIEKESEKEPAKIPEKQENNNITSQSTKPAVKTITLAEAKKKALADAGIDASKATFTKAELDIDDNIKVYDIEFYAGVYEYEYEINAETGAIIGKSVEARDSEPLAPQKPANNNKYIGVEKAKNIAVSNAGLKLSDVKFIKAEFDRDDGVAIYDIEFYTKTMEYEYEINAVTGAIRDKSREKIESEDRPTQKPVNSTYIGVDKAKSIAVTHAGLKISQVSFLKAKLDKDDGRAEYEVNFYYKGKEYEYTIDAVKGTVLEYDSEYED